MSKVKKVKQAPIRVNLSFTEDEFECLSKYANQFDTSFSGFIYMNMKMSAMTCEFLGETEIQKAYVELSKQLYELLDRFKTDKDDVYFEAMQQFHEYLKKLEDAMYMAEKLHIFSKQWSKLQLLK